MWVLSGFLVLLAFSTVVDTMKAVEHEQFPFQVAIQDQRKKLICGGLIILQDWVLTSSNCLKNHSNVRIMYGNADTHLLYKTVFSAQIIHEPPTGGKSRLAVVKLSEEVELSKVCSLALLPHGTGTVRNNTILSGWTVDEDTQATPSLYAIDPYYAINENCKNSSKAVKLLEDEFCGVADGNENPLRSPGAVVTRQSLALGMLTETSEGSGPLTFVKLGNHYDWILKAIGKDASNITWVDNPDSAPSHCVISLALLGISAFLLQVL